MVFQRAILARPSIPAPGGRIIRLACRLFAVFALASLLIAPTRAQEAEPRPFRLGFTPFPYEISYEAVDFTYAAIAVEIGEGVEGDSGVYTIPWRWTISQ